ncbi:diguanylate cyclase [Candidatus Bipolaricaulota bacterium]|nr:diguanylate cyclase [Candidatus Bipolaricaulota bacterium]
MSSKKERKIDQLSENFEDLKEWLFEVDGRSNLERKNGKEATVVAAKNGAARSIALLDSNGLFSYVDEDFANLFGYENSEELLGNNWQSLYSSEGIKKFTRNILPELKEQGSWKGKVAGKGKDGSRVYHCLELNETRDGAIVWKAGLCPETNIPKKVETGVEQRVVELRKGVAQLQDSESKGDIYHTTLKVMEKVLRPDAYLLYLEEDCTLMARGDALKNDHASLPNEIYEGLSSLTLSKDDVVRDEDFEEYTGFELSQQDYQSFVSVPVDARGTLQVASSEPGYFTEKDVNLLQILAHHVGERLAREEVEGDLRHQAIHDQLTGLYNRHYLKEVLTKEVERAQRYGHSLSFLMIDINSFKEVNDCYSHTTGDKVLVKIGDLLQDNVREVDTVIRYGGDEFLILLPETGDGSRIVVNRLKDKMETWNQNNDLINFPLSLAIGASNFDPQEEIGVEEKIAEADRKMYEDKRKSEK